MDVGGSIACDTAVDHTEDMITSVNISHLPESQLLSECPYSESDSCPCIGTEYLHEKSEAMATSGTDGWKTIGTGIHKGMFIGYIYGICYLRRSWSYQSVHHVLSHCPGAS